MAWIRLDDHFDEHEKWVDAGPEAGWLMIRALAYCNRRETDGHIKAAILDRIGSDFGPQKRKTLMRRLVDVGLLHGPGHGCGRCPDPPDGWQVHDYADFQQTRAELEAKREQRREAGRKGGKAKAKRAAKRTASDSLDDPPSKPVAGDVAKSKPGPGPVPGATDVAPSVAADKPPRARDEIFETLIGVCGWDLRALTSSQRGRTNKAAKELRDIGASPEGITVRAAEHRRIWPDLQVTPNSIAANYALLGTSIAESRGGGRREARPYDPAPALRAAGITDQ